MAFLQIQPLSVSQQLEVFGKKKLKINYFLVIFRFVTIIVNSVSSSLNPSLSNLAFTSVTASECFYLCLLIAKKREAEECGLLLLVLLAF